MTRPAHIVNTIPLLLIRLYRLMLSPIIGRFCRFTPTCSMYGKICFERFGFFRAFYLTAWRILRCQPFCRGGDDQPPGEPEKVA
ncbi:MAG: membrane protein insertion efficiency factor YidD [Pseudomonadota bacterium]